MSLASSCYRAAIRNSADSEELLAAGDLCLDAQRNKEALAMAREIFAAIQSGAAQHETGYHVATWLKIYGQA